MAERTYGPGELSLDRVEAIALRGPWAALIYVAPDLVARIRELEDGLAKHGDHLVKCEYRPGTEYEPDGKQCTCGLAELILGGGQ